jgi:hypothetical protein
MRFQNRRFKTKAFGLSREGFCGPAFEGYCAGPQRFDFLAFFFFLAAFLADFLAADFFAAFLAVFFAFLAFFGIIFLAAFFLAFLTAGLAAAFGATMALGASAIGSITGFSSSISSPRV